MKVLRDLSGQYGCPEYIRFDNGSEFMAKELVKWLKDLGVKTVCIRLGSPWENGFNESFNGRLRDEFLGCESFYTLKEMRVLTEWRIHYNRVLPHSAWGRPPAGNRIPPLHEAGEGARGIPDSFRYACGISAGNGMTMKPLLFAEVLSATSAGKRSLRLLPPFAAYPKSSKTAPKPRLFVNDNYLLSLV